MNGRVYDPTLARFTSADPHIQAPHNTQSYNRYTYVLNNPMKYTDPSGYFFSGVKKFVKKNTKTLYHVGGAALVIGGAIVIATSVTISATTGIPTPWITSLGVAMMTAGVSMLNYESRST